VEFFLFYKEVLMDNVKSKLNVRAMVVVSILGVLSFILMMFRFPLPFAPGFMDIDISEMPALLASFSLGPFAGFLVVVVKIVLKLFSGSSTIYVGELSNLIVSSAFVVSAGFIYKNNKTRKGAIIALISGTIIMSTIATLSNYFVIFPMYGSLMGITMQGFADTVAEINGLVTDFKTLMIFSILPFNLVKGIVTSFVTYLLYKRVRPLLIG